MKRVVVLGSTGSIGRNTLEVVANHPDRLQLLGVSARCNVDGLAEQIARFNPPLVSVWEEDKAAELSRLTGRRDVEVGLAGLLRLAEHPDVDIVVVATSGGDALLPLIRAIQAGKRIALASKELLVMAGELIMRLVREHGTTLVPIDSEHAALFQCLQGVPRDHVTRLIITASGGPLWSLPAAQRSTASVAQVLAHPKWRMGKKITVDSATLMNKGLEIIEARWLFDLPLERFAVLVHPEAAVHALIECVDGALLAQLSPCDMRLPIQYALSFPERWAAPLPRLSLAAFSSLRFFEPDPEEFPCLRLALDAARVGGSACAVLNGANDAAVHAYLGEQIAVADIPRVVAETLEQHTPIPHPTLDEILAADAWSRATAQELLHQWSPQ
jgi:1-deoxy-D-xylulose-5-phosphate reductoisomerase